MARRVITLPAFIDEVGVNRIAQIFCLERATVRKWRSGTQLPKALHMYELVKLSKGKLTYESIIDPWAKLQPSETSV